MYMYMYMHLSSSRLPEGIINCLIVLRLHHTCTCTRKILLESERYFDVFHAIITTCTCMQLQGKPRIMWNHLGTFFENTPFEVVRKETRECQFGPHYVRKQKERENLEPNVHQGNTQSGCHAHTVSTCSTLNMLSHQSKLSL